MNSKVGVAAAFIAVFVSSGCTIQLPDDKPARPTDEPWEETYDFSESADQRFIDAVKQDGVSTYVAEAFIEKDLPTMVCDELRPLRPAARKEKALELSLLTFDELKSLGVTAYQGGVLIRESMVTRCPEFDWR